LSHDIEGIVAVFDGRREIVDEVEDSESSLAKEINTRFKTLLEDEQFVDAVYGHMQPIGSDSIETGIKKR